MNTLIIELSERKSEIIELPERKSEIIFKTVDPVNYNLSVVADEEFISLVNVLPFVRYAVSTGSITIDRRYDFNECVHVIHKIAELYGLRVEDAVSKPVRERNVVFHPIGATKDTPPTFALVTADKDAVELLKNYGHVEVRSHRKDEYNFYLDPRFSFEAVQRYMESL